MIRAARRAWLGARRRAEGRRSGRLRAPSGPLLHDSLVAAGRGPVVSIRDRTTAHGGPVLWGLAALLSQGLRPRTGTARLDVEPHCRMLCLIWGPPLSENDLHPGGSGGDNELVQIEEGGDEGNGLA